MRCCSASWKRCLFYTILSVINAGRGRHVNPLNTSFLLSWSVTETFVLADVDFLHLISQACLSRRKLDKLFWHHD